MQDHILQVDHLKKYYPIHKGFFNKKVSEVKALDDISLTVERGTTIAIVGESGSGKSTLAKTIMKFESITDGVIHYNGVDISTIREESMKQYRKNIQMVHQDPSSSLNPRKTVRQIIEEPLIVHRYGSKEERLKRIKELMEIVDLPVNYIKRYPHTLSGGQKQRVGIARAISINSEFLILDEPTSALDVSVQAKIIALLEGIQEKFNLTYFFITHDLALVRNFASKVVVMQKGKIMELGDVETIFNNPQNHYTKKLLKSIPVVGEEEQAYIDSIVL